jgi:hypothetical protein
VERRANSKEDRIDKNKKVSNRGEGYKIDNNKIDIDKIEEEDKREGVKLEKG